jgi:flagellar protein FliS
MYTAQSALNQYRKINTESAMEGASPHRLIQMLMNGAIDRLAQARGAMEREDIPSKGLLLGKAVSILGGLQSSLDKSHPSDLTASLDSLYDYMQRRLLEANMRNDISMVDEVSGLMKTIKSGWDEIDPSVQV